jgi:xanthine dehydrogenase YagS FAD-binding subunit
MKRFEYVYPKNVESIPKILTKGNGQALLYAGGTDVLARMKEGIDKPQQVINLKAVRELDYIKDDGESYRIGATTRLVELIRHESLQKLSGLITAAKSIGSIQLRNMGTVGGNLCQRPRCWYFRGRHFPCLRKKGEICFAVDGENKYHCILGGDPCFIVHPSDLAPALITLDARVSILGPEGQKEVKLEEFFVLPATDPTRETILSPQEIVTEVIIPHKQVKSYYLKHKERESLDFALVSIAIAGNVNNGRLSNVRIALGGVAPMPWRARKAEMVLDGQPINGSLFEKAADAELGDAFPLAQNEFKIYLTKNLLKRALGEFTST